MATVDDLIPLIYHEQQEPGSMLCAQHALNALLQGAYFSALELSTIAHDLDQEEAQYDDGNHGQTSTNMDDTGFFSVQVLERALQAWGLSLARWRSERMRPYQAYPHAQMSFILNLDQHWYTLRRFGETCPDPDLNQHNVGHWFNLNSSLENPEWVSKLYLGMVLQQAEADGYSVFAVVQQDPEAQLELPLTSADHLAATIPEGPSSQSAGTPTTSAPQATTHPRVPTDFEDEDMELQAALHASLMGAAYDYPPMPTTSSSRASSSAAPAPLGTMRNFVNTSTPPAARTSPVAPPPVVLPPAVEEPDELEDTIDVDPVAASLARNRAFLERFQREQAAALRDTFDDEEAQARAARRREEYDEEEEMLRRAIAESEAMHRQARAGQDDDDSMGDEPPIVPPHPSTTYSQHRAYDDEDAELQAALKASLETVPEGFRVPDSPPHTARSLPAASVSTLVSPPIARQSSEVSESDTSMATESDAEPQQVEELSMEEIRRRRLARFGG